MENVFNRKLFRRKDAARDKLRSMGGIMASSEPLIREAMKTVQAAPQPQVDIQGIMQAQRRRGPMPAQPLPQIAPGMPAMPQPQMPAMASQGGQPQPQPMAQPQPQMQQPQPQPMAQPQPQQPAPRPMNPMQNQRMGFQQGGRPQDMMAGVPQQYMGAATGQIPSGSARGPVDVGQRAGAVVRERNQALDIETLSPSDAIQLTSSAMAGEMPVNMRPFTADNAGSEANAEMLNNRVQHIGNTMRNPGLSGEQKSREMIAAMGGNAAADDVQSELAKSAEKTFGKKLDREANIDAMNQAITGFAIAAGTSPRATQNIANGMLAGLKEMKDTEQGRIDTENAMRAAAARRSGGSSSGGDRVTAETRRDIIRNVTTNPGNYGINAHALSREEFGREVNSVVDAILGGQTATGGDPGAGGQTRMEQITAVDAAGNEFYSTDGVNFVDKDGNPYVPPENTG